MAGSSKRSHASKDSEGANKRSKTALSTKSKQNDQGNTYWEISPKRRVTVESFKGKTLVAIREFYEKDGKTLPGKSGISLTPEQFWALLSAIPAIKEELKSKGETEFVVDDDDEDALAKDSSKDDEDEDEE